MKAEERIRAKGFCKCEECFDSPEARWDLAVAAVLEAARRCASSLPHTGLEGDGSLADALAALDDLVEEETA